MPPNIDLLVAVAGDGTSEIEAKCDLNLRGMILKQNSDGFIGEIAQYTRSVSSFREF